MTARCDQIDAKASTTELGHCQKRAYSIVFLFAAWAAAIVLRMGQIMIVQRGDELADMTRESQFRGMIPAERGRLLDAGGRPLAWSVRRLRLAWQVPDQAETAAAEWAALAALPSLNLSPKETPWLAGAGQKIALVDNLPPTVLPELHGFIDKHPSFKIESGFQRCRLPRAELAQRLGEVIQRNGIEIGATGLERLHDSLLRGRPGIFQVRRDKHGRWIPETWEKVQEMQPGYDVFLPFRLDE